MFKFLCISIMMFVFMACSSPKKSDETGKVELLNQEIETLNNMIDVQEEIISDLTIATEQLSNDIEVLSQDIDDNEKKNKCGFESN